MREPKTKRYLRSTEPPVTSDRVYWGLISAGETAPQMLVTERKYCQAMLGAIPPAHRAKYSIVRAYVTVWKLGTGARRRGSKV